MLSVNFNKQRAEFTKQCRRNGLVIHKSPAAAIGLDGTPHDQRFTGFDVQIILGKQGERIDRRIKARAHLRLRRPLAHE